MRSLVVALLILATPLSASAKDRWREGRGGPPAAWGAARPDRAGRAGPGARGPVYFRPPPSRPGPYGPPPAYGGGPYRTQQEQAREAVREHRRVPLPQVIERLRRQLGAEYVDMHEARDPSGRSIYIVRFRQRGRYIDVPVDAQTGEVQR